MSWVVIYWNWYFCWIVTSPPHVNLMQCLYSHQLRMHKNGAPISTPYFSSLDSLTTSDSLWWWYNFDSEITKLMLSLLVYQWIQNLRTLWCWSVPQTTVAYTHTHTHPYPEHHHGTQSKPDIKQMIHHLLYSLSHLNQVSRQWLGSLCWTNQPGYSRLFIPRLLIDAMTIHLDLNQTLIMNSRWSNGLPIVHIYALT